MAKTLTNQTNKWLALATTKEIHNILDQLNITPYVRTVFIQYYCDKLGIEVIAANNNASRSKIDKILAHTRLMFFRYLQNTYNTSKV